VTVGRWGGQFVDERAEKGREPAGKQASSKGIIHW